MLESGTQAFRNPGSWACSARGELLEPSDLCVVTSLKGFQILCSSDVSFLAGGGGRYCVAIMGGVVFWQSLPW